MKARDEKRKEDEEDREERMKLPSADLLSCLSLSVKSHDTQEGTTGECWSGLEI